MKIDGIGLNNQIQGSNNKDKVEKEDMDKKGVKENKETPAAVFEKTSEEKSDIGTIYNKEAILKLKQQTENNRLKIITMVQDSIRRQKGASNIADLTLEITGLDKKGIEEAEAMLAEDGDLGVEKTSQRLVDFAIAISGGDTSKAGILRDAIDKGFSEAKRMLGGKLPKISEDTYKATMEKFDSWANGEDLVKE